MLNPVRNNSAASSAPLTRAIGGRFLSTLSKWLICDRGKSRTNLRESEFLQDRHPPDCCKPFGDYSLRNSTSAQSSRFRDSATSATSATTTATRRVG